MQCVTWRAMFAWPDPSALFEALGVEVVRLRAAAGDRDAQWILGWQLVREADGDARPLGAAGRSPQADVGLALCTDTCPVAH